MDSQQNAEHRRPWDQRPDESDLDFHRFLHYAKQGPGRTVAAAYDSAKYGEPKLASVSLTGWYKLANANSWRGRAAEWDKKVLGPKNCKNVAAYGKVILEQFNLWLGHRGLPKLKTMPEPANGQPAADCPREQFIR